MKKEKEILQWVEIGIFLITVILICAGYRRIALVTLLVLMLVRIVSGLHIQQDEELGELMEASEADRWKAESEAYKKQTEKLMNEMETLQEQITQKELQSEVQRISQEEQDSLNKDKQADSEKEVIINASMALLPPGRKDEELNLVTEARRAVAYMQENLAAAGIHVQLSAINDSLPYVADKKYMEILFRNVIDNSVKYMKRTGTLLISMAQIDKDIMIIIKDSGEGLKEEETQHIFELNYQGSNRVSGNGLGLSQAKAIVQAYGGTIYAKSGRDKGMAIYIQL